MNYSISQNGKQLDKKLYTFDKKTRTFSSDEDNLVLDFWGLSNCTFKTGPYCTFKTSSGCTFNTGYSCTFDTSSDCTFSTSYDCIFKTSSDCTFDTGSDCTFKTGFNCIVIRRDIYEVIELVENQKIKLNGYGIKGFTVLDEVISLSGKEVKITLDGVEYTAVIK